MLNGHDAVDMAISYYIAYLSGKPMMDESCIELHAKLYVIFM